MAGRAWHDGSRGGSARSRSSRSCRTSCTSAGEPSVSPIAKQSSQPAISSGSDVTSILSRWVHTALIVKAPRRGWPRRTNLDRPTRSRTASVSRAPRRSPNRSRRLAGCAPKPAHSPDQRRSAPDRGRDPARSGGGLRPRALAGRGRAPSCISQNRSWLAAASAAAAAANACGWISVRGKCRNTKRRPPSSLRSARSISRNARREYGHS